MVSIGDARCKKYHRDVIAPRFQRCLPARCMMACNACAWRIVAVTHAAATLDSFKTCRMALYLSGAPASVHNKVLAMLLDADTEKWPSTGSHACQAITYVEHPEPCSALTGCSTVSIALKADGATSFACSKACYVNQQQERHDGNLEVDSQTNDTRQGKHHLQVFNGQDRLH